MGQTPLSTPRERRIRALARELRRAQRFPQGQSPIYRHPTAPEQLAYRAFLLSYLAAAPERVRPATPAGFSASASSHDRVWLLGESEENRQGAAIVALRAESESRVLLEAPHTFFDSGTLPLAVGLFEHLQARALIFNTVHRARTAENRTDLPREQVMQLARSGTLASDAAHQRGALFSVAHQTLVATRPGTITVQVHGFRDRRVPRWDAVISGARSGTDVRPLVDQLRHALPKYRFGAFPRDSRDLGATRNVQGRLSHELSAPFVHMELSSSLRKALLDSGELLHALATAIDAWVGDLHAELAEHHGVAPPQKTPERQPHGR